MLRGCQMPPKQIGVCPVAGIVFLKQAMHRCMTTLDYCSDLAISCTFNVVIETKERPHEAAKGVRSRIYSDFLKKDTIRTDRCTDATIKNVKLKCTSDSMHRLQVSFFIGELIRAC